MKDEKIVQGNRAARSRFIASIQDGALQMQLCALRFGA